MSEQARIDLQVLLCEAAMVLDLRGVVLPPSLLALPNMRRDKREPGRREKEAAQLKFFKRITSFWRGQEQRIKERLSELYPDRKQAHNYLGDPFWSAEDEALASEIIPLLDRMAKDGVTLGLEGLAVGFDPTVTNQRAAAWARAYGGELVKFINEKTRGVVGEAVATFVETPGFTLGDLVEMLPYDDVRAQMIAVTETTRAYAEGNAEIAQDLREEYPGVAVLTEWFTNADDIVCEICGPLEGQIVDTEAGVFKGGDGEAYTEPPVHPNCRCWTEVSTDILAE